jgi:hypothetical protein
MSDLPLGSCRVIVRDACMSLQTCGRRVHESNKHEVAVEDDDGGLVE